MAATLATALAIAVIACMLLVTTAYTIVVDSSTIGIAVASNKTTVLRCFKVACRGSRGKTVRAKQVRSVRWIVTFSRRAEA